MKPLEKSRKLNDVCYEIRGPVLAAATQLEEEGHRILKLNIGNPAPFGFEAPDEILQDVIANLPEAQGYCDSRGLYSARKAIMQDCQSRGLVETQMKDIFLGNGVSELISIATQCLLNDGDEVLIPAPDYPLWTAATSLAGGKPVHYVCDEEADWVPDLADIRAKISDRTKAIVVINPNNPTGAVYPESVLRELATIAEEFQLVVLADEIYDRILYDDNVHHPMAGLVNETLCISFNGLSKAYRLAGFRSGWMILSGQQRHASDFIEGLQILASMRLCANVPAQFAIQTALGGYQSINEYLLPNGRLTQQRNLAVDMLNDIPGVSCSMPAGAIYVFPKIDTQRFNISDDERFVFDFLKAQKVLLVQGSGFNWPQPDHFRLVFLPHLDELEKAINKLGEFLAHYKQ
ncbi:MAG: pyridoxal phosphate-dependent aminotransferase [Pseudomonadales bacterium]